MLFINKIGVRLVVLSFTASVICPPAAAVVGGVPDIDTADANAVVDINGCTGALIAPRIVLTAKHCLGTLRYPVTNWKRNMAGYAHAGGMAAVATAVGSRLWIRNLGAPFHNQHLGPVFGSGPYVAMAPLNANEVIAMNDRGQMFRIETETREEIFFDSAGKHNITALAKVDDQLYATTNTDRLLARNLADPSAGFVDIGHANKVVSMTAVGSRLYAVTSDNGLWQRPADLRDRRWRYIGHAYGVQSLTTLDGQLLAQTPDGSYWTRYPVHWEEHWQRVGDTSSVLSAMVAHANTFIATADTGPEILSGDISLKWIDTGPMQDASGALLMITAMTGTFRDHQGPSADDSPCRSGKPSLDGGRLGVQRHCGRRLSGARSCWIHCYRVACRDARGITVDTRFCGPRDTLASYP